MKKLKLIILLFLSASNILSTPNREHKSLNSPPVWTQIAFQNQGVYVLRVNAAKIYAGTDIGVEYSTDDGISWNQTGLNVSSVLSLDIDGTNMIAGTNNNGVYFSSNGGQNWSQNYLTTQYIYGVCVRGNILLATPWWAPYYGIFRSSDFGNSWNNSFFSVQFYAMSKNSTDIFVTKGGSGGVYKAFDNGISWELCGLNGIYVNCLATEGAKIYAGTHNQGVYISNDDGQNWNQTSLNSLDVYSISANGPVIIAGGLSNGVLLSTDNGINWTPINDGLGTGYIGCLLVYDNYAFLGNRTSGLWRRPLTEITGIQNKKTIPQKFSLYQNYPNPFNPTTTISYDLPQGSFVMLIVYDVSGKNVTTLVNDRESAGSYKVEFDGTNLPSGVYFYKLVTGSYSATRKLVLIK